MGQRTAICLTAEEEQTLRQWARAGTSEHRMVERAKVVLLAHQGKSNLEIAAHLKTRPARVSKWRQRFERRLDGLQNADRTGRPAHYDKATERRVLTMLDESPPEGCGKWSGSLLAEALETSATIKYGACCASMTSACGGGGVGVSARIRNSASEQPICGVVFESAGECLGF